MADITKCEGNNCPVKSNCYRYTALEDKFRQSYFVTTPIEINNNIYSCKRYWKNSLNFTVDNFTDNTE